METCFWNHNKFSRLRFYFFWKKKNQKVEFIEVTTFQIYSLFDLRVGNVEKVWGGVREYDTCLLYLKSIQTFNLLLINGTGFVNLTFLLILQDLPCLDTFHRRNNNTVLLEIRLRGTFFIYRYCIIWRL